MTKAIMYFAGVLGAAAVIALAVIEARDEARTGSLVGRGMPAPAFKIDKLGGGTIDLESYRGKVVMLDFWATWCPPCIEEMPILVKLAKEYEGKGLAFIAASRDDPPESAKVEVALYVDRRVPDLRPYVGFAFGDEAARYGVEALPTLYFIGRDGKVFSANRGALNEAQLRAQIEAALGE